MNLIQEEVEAFEARMEAMPSGCIEWKGNRDPNGYGRFCFKRKITLAHRVSWRLFCGPLPEDACVLHKCDNPPCVNPDHLFLGDRGDNARDMAAKGRQWVQKDPAGRPICPTELRPRGEGHGMSKLTAAEVLAIRRKASVGALGKDLADEYGCARSLISAVVLGQIWQHVGGPIRPAKVRTKGVTP